MDTLISVWLILRFFQKLGHVLPLRSTHPHFLPDEGIRSSSAASCISQILSHVSLWFWNMHFSCPSLLSPGRGGDDHHLCDGRSCVLKSSPTPHCLHIPIHVLHSRSFAWQELYICLHARRYTPPPHLKFFWKWPRWMFWSSHRSMVSEQTHLVSMGLLGSCLVSRNPPAQRAEQPLQASAVEQTKRGELESPPHPWLFPQAGRVWHVFRRALFSSVWYLPQHSSTCKRILL